MPLAPGLEDARYPTEPAPAACEFIGANLVTRAAWSNQDGVGMDFDLRLPQGWYAPSKLILEVPPALAHRAPVVHAVVHDDGVLIQPHNLLATRAYAVDRTRQPWETKTLAIALRNHHD